MHIELQYQFLASLFISLLIMTLFTFVVILSLLIVVVPEDCVINHNSLENAWERQLHEDLRCNYKVSQPPNNKTEVRVRFFLKQFSFDEKEEQFKIFSWLYLRWQDERLKWNESKYDGITETVLNYWRLWTPLPKLLTVIDEYYRENFGECTVTSNGVVNCMPRIEHEVMCNTRLTDWPYDTQNCTLEYGTWSPRDKIKYKFNSKRGVSMLGAEYGPGWTIMHYKQEEHEDQDSQLKITFFLEREAASLKAIIVVPTILLTILNISSLFMDLVDILRLGMQVFSLFCHFFFLSDINGRIPKHSADTPTILLYLRGSVFISCVLIMLTSFLSNLQKKTTVPPNWIAAVNDTVLKSYGKYIVWPRWEVALNNAFISNDSLRKTVEIWTDFSNIINSVCVVLIVMVYLFFIGLYLPRETQIDYDSY